MAERTMLPKKELRTLYDSSDSFFGFDKEVYATYMDYDQVKDILKKGITKKSWDKDRHPYSEKRVTADARKYMEFAVGKALDHRGISANRSVEKMKAWMTILGHYDEIDWYHYANYGAPILKEICDLMGWEEVYADEYRSEFLNMARGKPCRPDCNEGCGM